MATALVLTVLAYALLVGGLYLGQRRLIYFPQGDLPDRAMAGAEDYEAVTLETEDGLRLLAWYRAPGAADAPVVVYYHGNAGHIGHRVGKARALTDAGFGVLLVEYRGYGGNPGSATEAGLYADARAALAFLAGRGIDEGRLVLYGESLGTGVAVEMARGRTPLALVLEAPFSSLGDVAQARFPLFPARAIVRDRYDSAAKIGDVSAPLLVVHGARDRTIPIRFGRRLFEAAREPKEFRVYPEAGHNDLYEHGAGADIAAFVKARQAGHRGPEH